MMPVPQGESEAQTTGRSIVVLSDGARADRAATERALQALACLLYTSPSPRD